MSDPTGAPVSWDDGLELLDRIAFHLRRLLPDPEASALVTRVENWVVESREIRDRRLAGGN